MPILTAAVILGMAGLLFVLLLVIAPLVERIAICQEHQAAALEDIADSLYGTVVNGDGTLSDCTRIVTALEKLAGIEPPAAPKPDNVTAKE